MNILADLHHGDLYHSLRMLFEYRLGWNLYRPIGMDWHKKGYWKYNEQMSVVQQFLRVPDSVEHKPTYIEIKDHHNEETFKCLTFDQFKKTKIDIIIASVAQHEVPYKRLQGIYKPEAKFIRQAGNVHDIVDPQICKNIMATTTLQNVPDDVNLIIHHQEFDTEIFKYTPPKPELKIKNFMNCLPDSRDFYLWPRYKTELKNFDWKMFGILGEDGIIGTTKEIASEMQDSTFIWHVKPGGDGFGHVIHNAFAVGRPIITRASHYKGLMAECLLQDKKTCIDLDKRSFEENIKVINHFAKPANHKKMCENTIQCFNKNVKFDKEFKLLKKFLKHLK